MLSCFSPSLATAHQSASTRPTRSSPRTSTSFTPRSSSRSCSRRSCASSRCTTASSTARQRPEDAQRPGRLPRRHRGVPGWLAGLAISQFLSLHRIEPGWPTTYPIVKFSIVARRLVIVVLGLWDDILGVKPWVKIAGQVAAAAFLLWDGVGLEASKPLLGVIFGKLVHVPGFVQVFLRRRAAGQRSCPSWLIIACSAVMVVGVIVVCCNASNLMDGLDGLCGGVTAIIAAGFLFVAVHLAMVGGGDQHQLGRAARHPRARAARRGARVRPVQLQPRVDLHGRHRQHAARVLLRHA